MTQEWRSKQLDGVHGEFKVINAQRVSRRMRHAAEQILHSAFVCATFNRPMEPWKPFFRRWRDLDGLVHEVKSQGRADVQGNIMTIWMTKCQKHALAFGKPAFGWSKCMTTCLDCVSRLP